MAVKFDIKDYLFYDIETHRVNEWEELTPALQQAFINHNYDPSSFDTPAEHYKVEAGLHAEFSHVICVCFGYENTDGQFVTMQVVDLDEKVLLQKCAAIFNAFEKQGLALAGHNINSCDSPYLVKRYIINKMKVPNAINHYGKKPWEIEDIDSMNLWKFGMWTNKALETICAAMDIPCKEGEITGGNLYTYNINDVPLDKLALYCLQDVTSNYQMVKQIFEYL